MKMRTFLSAAVVVMAVAANGFALTPEHTDFGKGPAQYYMTKDEIANWKKIGTDDEAQAFIDLFWARRDPSPGNARNEFLDEFDKKVAYADEKFPGGRKRGAMTDRGRVFILFGTPSRIQRTDTAPSTTIDDRAFGRDGGMSPSTEKSQKQVWFYDADLAQKYFDAPTARINFVDQFNTHEFTIERGQGAIDDKAAQQRLVEKLITQAQLTEAPKPGAAPAAVAPAATPVASAAAAPMVEFITPALRTAVDEFVAAPKSPYEKQVFVTWGEFVTSEGEYFVPVSLYVPAAAGLKAEGSYTFFGSVEDESGKTVAVIEEPAKLTASKNDFFVDKSLKLPAGKFRGVFGLAENGKPIAAAKSEMSLAGTLDKNAPGVSSLIVSDNIYALPAAQLPNDPFAFGGIKVVPKANKTFGADAEIWYFFEIRNPGLTEANIPNVQMKVDVETTDAQGKTHKMSAPPREVDAIELKGVPGHFGIGNSLPPNTFQPGFYTIKVKATDTVRKTSWNLQDTFTIVAAK